MAVFNVKEFVIGCVTSVAVGIGIGVVIGRKQGAKIGYNAAVEELEKTEKRGMIVNEPECNGCPESNEPEQKEELPEECKDYLFEEEDEELEPEDEELLEEACEELVNKEGVEYIDVEDIAEYIDGYSYTMENLRYYPEDEMYCETLISDDGPLDDSELLSITGDPDVEYIKGRFRGSDDTLYIANHDNMCIYSIEVIHGENGETAYNMPELV